jgi:phosphoesterase RecJ-like protein
MKPIQFLYPHLHEPKDVVVTMHQKPDPDAMGSSLALALFLKGFGHRVTVVSPTNWADFLKWMPGCEDVLDYESQTQRADALLDKAEWLFCLDFNILSRTRRMARKIESLKAQRILIDHHEEPDTAAFDYGISVIPKSSTAEMVYEMIVESGHGDKIDERIAQCLYAGVMADTGSFRFPATTPGVHRMVADLMSRGLNHTRVHQEIYDNHLENRLRFIGHVLSSRMDVMYPYNTVLITIPKGDLLRFNIRTGDTEGLVNIPLSIKGIELSAIVIDRDEERRWSFRSRERFDCSGFARRHFEGGGHYNAAGGRSSQSLEETARLFKDTLAEYESQLQPR